ncbi:type II secretion system F family protein [uncultured Clostridium sp.]|uniref:type II secretion system F family protein n=1 Tax=uncultured Clostridium sp. TaxID=59620 RepID=UPI0025EC2C28|nr:type II secretion system F family protein [uncultured Clostridium sp.]
MPVFNYEAKNVDGIVIKGKLEVDTREQLQKNLREKNFFLIKVEEEVAANNLSFDKFKEIPFKDLSMFCKELYFTLSAGIPVIRSLEIINVNIENKRLKAVIDELIEEIQKGRNMSDVLKEKEEIPNMFASMVSVGESTGYLDEIIKDMSIYYDKQHQQKLKIKSALSYPKVLVVFGALITMGLITFVVPTFVETITSSGGQVPLITRIVIGISDFCRNNVIILTILVVGIIIFKKYVLDKNENYIYERDKFLMNSKRLGAITQQVTTARFARTFSILLKGGMGIIESIDIVSESIGNEYTKQLLQECKKLVNVGSSVGEALEAKEVFPSLLTQMMKIGEESGNIDSILDQISDFYDSESDFAIKKFTSLIEPVVIIGLALVVGLVVVALVLPMFQSMGSVG